MKGNITISIPESDTLLECARSEIYPKVIVLLKEILMTKINSKIDRVNELAIVMSHTTDRDIFYTSVDEIENILTELSGIEQNLKLSLPPSEHLRRFRDAKDKQIALLEKRISEKAETESSDRNIVGTQNEIFDSQEDIQKELSALEAYDMLKKANKLSEVANKTTDRNEFYNSINEIKDILKMLSEYEKKLPFIGSPSVDLENLEKMEQHQIKLLEKRIKKKERFDASVKQKENPDPYKDYYDKINAEKTNNLNISFEDVKQYDMKPFDLKKPFISDGNFTAIALEGENLETAKAALILVNRLLFPYKNLYKKPLPTKITTDYILNQKLPYSHLRLNSYTYSYADKEYPILLWLSYFGEYGNEYLYKINFDKEGKVGNCDLQFYNYTVQIRKNDAGLYVKKISETLKTFPYGTKILYTSKPNNNSRISHMNKYDVERYAIECNAYVVREERKEQNSN